MTPLVIQLPLDPTGSSPDNLVENEPHELIANRTYRAIAPLQGAFYAKSLKVYDGNTLLTDGTNGTPEQYYACEMYELPSDRYGAEIDAIIIIKDPTVSNNVSISYQALGGPYGTSAQAIIQQIEALGLDARPLAWGDIVGKPSELTPAKHLHDLGDVYGFEFVVHALDRIRDAIEIGDQASHDAIYRYIDAAIDALANVTDALQAALTAHINDIENPHKTTAAQVGAHTKAEVKAITDAILALLDKHIADTDNPHETTAAQVGTYDYAAIDGMIATVTALANAAKLPYTPVQQGGGARQGTNKVCIGWDGARIRAQVDSTDIGGLTGYDEYSNAVASLQNQINGKQPTGPYAQTGVNMSVSFWDLNANGTIYCANDIWAFNSDERLKEQIVLIPSALEKVRKVRGVLYRYRVEAQELLNMEDRQYMGFIAQEVQAVCPEIVGLAPFDKCPHTGKSLSGQNFLTIQYDKYCALLNEALREVDDKVEALYSRLGFTH